MKKSIGILLLSFVLLLASCSTPSGSEEKAETKTTLKLDKKDVIAGVNDIFTVTGKTTPSASVSIDDVTVTADKQGDFELSHVYESNKSYKVLATKKGLEKSYATINVTQPVAIKEKKQELEVAAKQEALNKIKTAAKPNAAKIPYNVLNQDPNKFAHQPYYLKGQVTDSGATTLLRVNMTQDGDSWKNPVTVIYAGTTTAVKNDIIEVYGTVYGIYAYDTTSGNTVTIPGITASIITVLK